MDDGPGVARGVPGVATVVGGLLLIFAGNRIGAMIDGWLAVLAGAWFVVGGQFAPMLGIGSAGDPVATTERKRAAARGLLFLRPGCADHLPGRGRPGAACGPAGPRCRAPEHKWPSAGSVPGEQAVHVGGGGARPRWVSSGAMTRPRVEITRRGRSRRPKRGGVAFRRQSAGAPGGRRVFALATPSAVAARRSQSPSPVTELGDGLSRRQSNPSSRRSVTYLAMIGGETCGMSLSGPIFASCTAARNRSVGATDPQIGFSGFW